MSVEASDSFFSEEPGCGIYERTRKCPSLAETRRQIEGLWRDFRDLCGDANFVAEARKADEKFLQRTWELLLFGVLRRRGFCFARVSSGPDLCLRNETGRVWIEATAPGPGSGRDAAVREYQTDSGGTLYSVNHDKMLLRYTSALRAKARQYSEFVKRREIGSEEPFVVAISAGAINDAEDTPDGLPTVLPALFPIEQVWELHIPSARESAANYRFRPEVKKLSGSPVSTTAFTTDEYEDISAVVFCWHFFDCSALDGHTLITVHNPCARVPLPTGFFPFGREFYPDWVDGEVRLLLVDRRPAKSTKAPTIRRRCKVWSSRGNKQTIAVIPAGATVVPLCRRGRMAKVVYQPENSRRVVVGWVSKKHLKSGE